MPSREQSPTIDALAVDYDRTLTDLDLVLVPDAVRAIRRAREAGKKVVVVSGRGLDFLERELGGLVDAIVGENGCFLLHAGARVGLAPSMEIRRVASALGVPVEIGEAMLSVAIEDEPLLRAAIERDGLDARLVRNRDRVMLLPRGVDKAAGVLAALDALGVDPVRAAAAGDGENDLVMLQAVGYGIAVANAVPELQAAANHVTPEPGGHGVARWIEERWLARPEART